MLTLLSVMVWILVSVSLAQEVAQDLLIHADKWTTLRSQKVTELEGNVQIVYDGKHITCERAILNDSDSTLELFGNVKVSSLDVDTYASRATLSTNSKAGTFYDAVIISGKITFEGKILSRQEDDSLIAYDARYTACDSCPEAWSFQGRKIEAKIGGYAHISHPVFKARQLPVLWLPYIVIPLKSERQTGLLFPSFGFIGNGNWVDQTLFWAIDDHHDATLTARYFTERGLQGIVDYNYRLSRGSRGRFQGFVIPQTGLQSGDRLYDSQPSGSRSSELNRWFLNYSHFHNLPEGFTNRVKIEATSDLQYLADFPMDAPQLGEPALESSVSLSKSFNDVFVNIEGAYFTNLLVDNPFQSNQSSVHRLPDITAQTKTSQLGKTPFLWDFSFNYVQFARDSFSTDRVVNPITFEPLEFSRSGQRIRFEPKLYYPLQLGRYVNMINELSYQDTLYIFPDRLEDPSNARRILRLRTSAQTEINRVYTVDKTQDRYRHSIKPEISLTHVPFFQQATHPFFNGRTSEDLFFRQNLPITDLDIFGSGSRQRGLQFDYFDRVYDRSLLTFSIANYLFHSKNPSSPSHQLGFLQLSQSYDAYAASLGDRRAFSELSGVAGFQMGPMEATVNFQRFPNYNVTNLSSKLRLQIGSNNFLELGNRRFYSDFPDDSFIVDPSSRSEDVFINAGVKNSFLFVTGGIVLEGNETRRQRTGNSVLSYQAQGIIRPPGGCWGIMFNYLKPAGGEATNGINISLLFDGSTDITMSPQMALPN